jgi:hypothetical protein
MMQIFPRWFDTVARAGIVGGVLLVPATALGLAILYSSDYVTGANTAYEQPVPFSHEHHVGRLGIDCRYCHESATHSAFAGMPSTRTCMNCHQQIWVGAETLAPVRESWKTGTPIRWRRVHNLPGFVYFAHNIHISKGVGCVECHGRLDRMPLTWQVQPLTMAWCLECHRDPSPHLRPEREVFSTTWTVEAERSLGNSAGRDEFAQRLKEHFRIRDTRTLTSCSTCHR